MAILIYLSHFAGQKSVFNEYLIISIFLTAFFFRENFQK